MRVCCTINYAPFVNGRKRFDTLGEALDYFRREVADSPDRTLGTDDADGCYFMSVYPELDRYGKPCECDNVCCYHDYPIAYYTVGPRGGVRKEAI